MEKLAWADQTAVHPLGLVALIVLAIATLALPRRYAALPMILLACLISARQRIVLGGMDFTFLRILVLVGWVRVFGRGELRKLKSQRLDALLGASVLAMGLLATLRSGTVSAAVFYLGQSFDAFGMYYLFRVWIRSWEDIRAIVTGFVLASIPVTLAFLVESSTARNPFALFGGVPEITLERDGRLRCQGPFSHPILAGAFWASLFPLFGARWFAGGKGRVQGLVGMITGFTIVMLSASSTPLAGVFAGIFAGFLFRFRAYMRQMRWALVGTLCMLQLVMDKPIYHLISRIDLVGGSTGWHRYHLIDQAVRHFSEWAIAGTPSTDHWGHLTGDVANQYVLVAVRGGLLSLILFIAVLVVAYQGVGRMLARSGGDRRRQIWSWALGASLFAHTMMMFAVSYFGQMVLAWYLPLAMIGSLQSAVPVRRKRRARDPEAPSRSAELRSPAPASG